MSDNFLQALAAGTIAGKSKTADFFLLFVSDNDPLALWSSSRSRLRLPSGRLQVIGVRHHKVMIGPNPAAMADPQGFDERPEFSIHLVGTGHPKIVERFRNRRQLGPVENLFQRGPQILLFTSIPIDNKLPVFRLRVEKQGAQFFFQFREYRHDPSGFFRSTLATSPS